MDVPFFTQSLHDEEPDSSLSSRLVDLFEF
jgi:hypothetical protein